MLCWGCGDLFQGKTRIIRALGQHWHPDCFQCGHCRRVFSNMRCVALGTTPYCNADCASHAQGEPFVASPVSDHRPDQPVEQTVGSDWKWRRTHRATTDMHLVRRGDSFNVTAVATCDQEHLVRLTWSTISSRARSLEAVALIVGTGDCVLMTLTRDRPATDVPMLALMPMEVGSDQDGHCWVTVDVVISPLLATAPADIARVVFALHARDPQSPCELSVVPEASAAVIERAPPQLGSSGASLEITPPTEVELCRYRVRNSFPGRTNKAVVGNTVLLVSLSRASSAWTFVPMGQSASAPTLAALVQCVEGFSLYMRRGAEQQEDDVTKPANDPMFGQPPEHVDQKNAASDGWADRWRARWDEARLLPRGHAGQLMAAGALSWVDFDRKRGVQWWLEHHPAPPPPEPPPAPLVHPSLREPVRQVVAADELVPVELVESAPTPYRSRRQKSTAVAQNAAALAGAQFTVPLHALTRERPYQLGRRAATHKRLSRPLSTPLARILKEGEPIESVAGAPVSNNHTAASGPAPAAALNQSTGLNMLPKKRLALGARFSPAGRGMRVEAVADGLALDLATVKVGDVVLSINGNNTRSREDLEKAAAFLSPGDLVVIEVMRVGATDAVALTTEVPMTQEEADRRLAMYGLGGTVGADEDVTDDDMDADDGPEAGCDV